MSNVLEGTALGNELIARGEARGALKARAADLHVLLVDRFGDLEELEALGMTPALEGDVAAALNRIRSAATPADLRS